MVYNIIIDVAVPIGYAFTRKRVRRSYGMY